MEEKDRATEDTVQDNAVNEANSDSQEASLNDVKDMHDKAGNGEQQIDNETKEEGAVAADDQNSQKNDDYKDKYVSLSADFDNFRKRSLKEKMELTKSAGENILKQILPVVDDFDRGMQSITKAEDVEAVKKGIELIHSKFLEFLKQQGVQEIPAKNEQFDTDFHEAVTKIAVPEEELKGKVVDVLEKGYKLYDKVIRFSKVVIGE
jgi:molecular chaperone GrpE